MRESFSDIREELRDKEYAHAYASEFLNESIATQIKVIRQQYGWTQQELAERAGMKQERISVLENVNYASWRIDTLRRIAEAYDLTLHVSFDEFSTTIGDMQRFGRKSLQRKPRCEDLGFGETRQEASALLSQVLNHANSQNVGHAKDDPVVYLAARKEERGWKLDFSPSGQKARVFELPASKAKDDASAPQIDTSIERVV